MFENSSIWASSICKRKSMKFFNTTMSAQPFQSFQTDKEHLDDKKMHSNTWMEHFPIKTMMFEFTNRRLEAGFTYLQHGFSNVPEIIERVFDIIKNYTMRSTCSPELSSIDPVFYCTNNIFSIYGTKMVSYPVIFFLSSVFVDNYRARKTFQPCIAT